MSKSNWKLNFIDPYLLSTKFKKEQKKIIWSRNSTIPSFLIGQAVFIYNGIQMIKVHITREKVGFKFGEFAPTRKFTRKVKNLKKDSKKKSKGK